ncbi:MAG: FHA domain-containing protein [Armatimonadota bacterium]
MARVTKYLLLAAIGGFLAWAILEPINSLTPYVAPGETPRDMTFGQMMAIGAIFGMLLGLFLGLAEAFSGVSPRDAVKSVVVGVGVGILGGMLGLTLGNSLIYGPLVALSGWNGTDIMNPLQFVIHLIARSAGWAMIGLLTGLAQGISTQSAQKMTNGAVGGVIGGFIGGMAFELLSHFGVPPEMLRMVGFTTTAAAVGLFIGFIEEVRKKAWIVHLKGRNEGREFTIFKPETIAGRDELVDIPIFGDPDVEPRHFVIKADQNRHVLMDMNTTAGTSVNGQKVQKQTLRDGDIVQVGMTRLLFRDKATRSFTSQPVDPYSATGARIPTSEHICPFCGSIKDAAGNCSCSAGVQAPGQQVQNPPSAPQNQTMQQTVVSQPNQTVQTTQAMQNPFSGAPIDPFSGTPLSPNTPGAGARLVAAYGPYTGQVYNLNSAGETTIGRQSDQMISLSNDNTVSRQHAKVVNEGGQFVLYDCGSANGTHVNNTRITRHVLTPGDLVQIGSTKFKFEG